MRTALRDNCEHCKDGRLTVDQRIADHVIEETQKGIQWLNDFVRRHDVPTERHSLYMPPTDYKSLLG